MSISVHFQNKTTTLNLHVIVRMIQGKFYKILDFS